MKTIFVLGALILCPSVITSQESLTCEAIGQSRIEHTEGAFVEVDIPQNARKISAYFMVRRLAAGIWQKCNEETNREGRHWPDLKHPGADVDGSLHYAAVAPAASAIGDKYAFTPEEDVRLVLTYHMPGPLCVSQVTSHKNPGSAEARWIFIPSGKPSPPFKTWFRVKAQWKLCDDFAGPRNQCVPTGITFDSASQQDEGDKANGWWFKCRDNYDAGTNTPNVHTEGFCRVQLMYRP